MTVLNTIRTLIGIEGVLCFLFFYKTEGLGYIPEEAGSYLRVQSLFSSGSDDDIGIFLLGAICIILFLILMIREWGLYAIILIVATGFFFQIIATFVIQVGSIFDTIIYGHNLILLCIVLCQFGIFVRLFYEKIRNRLKI